MAVREFSSALIDLLEDKAARRIASYEGEQTGTAHRYAIWHGARSGTTMNRIVATMDCDVISSRAIKHHDR